MKFQAPLAPLAAAAAAAAVPAPPTAPVAFLFKVKKHPSCMRDGVTCGRLRSWSVRPAWRFVLPTRALLPCSMYPLQLPSVLQVLAAALLPLVEIAEMTRGNGASAGGSRPTPQPAEATQLGWRRRKRHHQYRRRRQCQRWMRVVWRAIRPLGAGLADLETPTRPAPVKSGANGPNKCANM